MTRTVELDHDSVSELVKEELMLLLSEDFSADMPDDHYAAFECVVKYFMEPSEILEHFGEAAYNEFFDDDAETAQ